MVITVTAATLAQFIAANPGQRIEQIGKGLNMRTSELSLPIKKLIRDKRIVTKGDRRATRYYPCTPKIKAKAKAKTK